MMQQMRQNTKIILWIVVIAFVTTIFAVWGMDLRTGSTNTDPNILGKVNDEPITRLQYRAAYDQLSNQLRAMSADGELNYAQQEMLQEQSWRNIIMAILTSQQIEELGITVTDEEIINFLRTTPPPEVQQVFRDEEGNFDYQAYQAQLNNPEVDWTSLENLARQRLPQIKLNQYMSAQVHVSADEVRRAYEEANRELTIRYVEFPIEIEGTEEYTPSEEEIEKYYSDHIDDYTEGEKASLEIVKFEIEPSKADKEGILYSLGVIRSQIISGEDFSVLAQTYSEAPTAATGGETGWIGEDQRDSQVLEALEALNDGDLGEPVETEDGFYLIKRLEKRTGEDGKAEYNAQEIFIKLVASPSTTDSLYVLADQLSETAQSVGLRAAAEEKQLEVLSPEPTIKNFPIGSLGVVPAIDGFAFASEPGAVSNVLRDESRFYICQLIERIPETATPLDEVKETIILSLVHERKKHTAWRKADGFHRQTEMISFESSAEAHQLEIHNPEPFRVNDAFDPFGSRSVIAKTALALEIQTISPPIEFRGSYYVIQLMNRSPVEEEEFQKSAPGLSEQLYQEKLQRFVIYWYEMLEKNSKIEDFRGTL